MPQTAPRYDVSTHSRPKAAAATGIDKMTDFKVSTHSRPKAAAHAQELRQTTGRSFNTQPPEGGCLRLNRRQDSLQVSTHSRPKAAAQCIGNCEYSIKVSTHSRPKAAAWYDSAVMHTGKFQHTAARRRLHDCGV